MNIIEKLGIKSNFWEVGFRTNFYLVDGTDKEKELMLKANIPLRFEAIGVGTRNGGVAIIPLDESNIKNAYLIAAVPELFIYLTNIINAKDSKKISESISNAKNMLENKFPEIRDSWD